MPRKFSITSLNAFQTILSGPTNRSLNRSSLMTYLICGPTKTPSSVVLGNIGLKQNPLPSQNFSVWILCEVKAKISLRAQQVVLMPCFCPRTKFFWSWPCLFYVMWISWTAVQFPHATALLYFRAAFAAEPLLLDIYRYSSCTWCTGSASTTVSCFCMFFNVSSIANRYCKFKK